MTSIGELNKIPNIALSLGIAFAATFLLYAAEPPSHLVGLFLLLLITLGLGATIYSSALDRLIKDERGLPHIILNYVGAFALFIGVIIPEEHLAYWPLIIVNAAAIIHFALTPFLPAIVKPLPTQLNEAHYHYMYTLNGKKNGISEKDAEKYWNSYLSNIRNKASWVDHNIPANECFQPVCKQERKAIVQHVSQILSTRNPDIKPA